eukprot:1912610-Rhodomonas_salina.4
MQFPVFDFAGRLYCVLNSAALVYLVLGGQASSSLLPVSRGIRYVSTGHRIAPYASSVPDIA